MPIILICQFLHPAKREGFWHNKTNINLIALLIGNNLFYYKIPSRGAKFGLPIVFTFGRFETV
jgi:hypothetical protein